METLLRICMENAEVVVPVAILGKTDGLAHSMRASARLRSGGLCGVRNRAGVRGKAIFSGNKEYHALHLYRLGGRLITRSRPWQANQVKTDRPEARGNGRGLTRLRVEDKQEGALHIGQTIFSGWKDRNRCR